MIDFLVLWIVSVTGALLADAFARPDNASSFVRAPTGVWVIALTASILFGSILAMSGNPALAALLVMALSALVTLASNAKRRVLGEPLLFTDLALIGALFTHPQFYFSVLALWQQAALVVGLAVLIATLAWLFEPSLAMAAVGMSLALGAAALMAISLRTAPYKAIARAPDIDGDVGRLGLIPTILLYWLRWREARADLSGQSASPAPSPSNLAMQSDQGLIVVVQCESFADPAELFETGGAALPELARAKADAQKWGNLEVSGFGAYTMRTEYGVLFGREERDLGFLLYDPYLTALDDPAPALPQKLGAGRWESVFVHPHDMRFYRRDQILPKAGFDQLIGEDSFAKPDRAHSRYVSDAEVAERILESARAAQGPTFIYAVTMENHGPWAPHSDASTVSMVDNYNRLVLAGDTMLGRLREGLDALGRPSTLVFFGDHRPTIPGASDPGGSKHTPYRIVRCGGSIDEAQDSDDAAGRRRDLTPAQLHQAILDHGLAH